MLVIQSLVVFFFTLMFLCRYKDVVECERIVVKAFKTPHEVASFRAAKLSDDFYQMKADFERRKTMTMVKDDITRDPTRDLLGGKCGVGGGINNLDNFYYVKSYLELLKTNDVSAFLGTIILLVDRLSSHFNGTL